VTVVVFAALALAGAGRAWEAHGVPRSGTAAWEGPSESEDFGNPRAPEAQFMARVVDVLDSRTLLIEDAWHEAPVALPLAGVAVPRADAADALERVAADAVRECLRALTEGRMVQVAPAQSERSKRWFARVILDDEIDIADFLNEAGFSRTPPDALVRETVEVQNVSWPNEALRGILTSLRHPTSCHRRHSASSLAMSSAP
jgi:hypothetical protein